MSDPIQLVNYVQQYHDNPSSFIYQGKYFVRTFAGQDKTFGESNLNDGWQKHFKDPLTAAGINIFFVPSWFVDANHIFESYPVFDRYFNWQTWPTTDSELATDTDNTLLQGANSNGKAYMAGVSP